MSVLVVGASGATGKLLVAQLLERGHKVIAIVRAAERLPEPLRNHENVSIVEASVLDLDDAEMARQLHGCTAVASCLGHNLTFKGMFGPPRRLVTDATRRLCDAAKVNAPSGTVKFVLMNTTGNRNRGIEEPISFAQRCIIGLLRLLLPPHADNEQAAEHLRSGIGPNDATIEWTVVRPDGLVDQAQVTDYELHPSPIRSAIFDAGQTSRINVAHFMAALITDDTLWAQWRGQMPVIYNRQAPEK